MSTQGLPIAMDRRIPFVAAVLDVIEGRGDVSAAIEVLSAAERRCGVAIWRELPGSGESQLAAGSFVPVNPESPPTLREALELMRDWSAFEKVFLDNDNDPRSQALDAGLVRLLGETHLIVSGMDFTNEHFVRSEAGAIGAWTQRAWGALLAEWANDAGWGPVFNERGQRYTWTYVDLYHLNNAAIEQYERWQEVVRDVLEQKTLRALG